MKKIIQECSGGYSDLIGMSENSVFASKVPLLRTFLQDVKFQDFWLKIEKWLKQSKMVQKQLIMVRITNVYTL